MAIALAGDSSILCPHYQQQRHCSPDKERDAQSICDHEYAHWRELYLLVAGSSIGGPFGNEHNWLRQSAEPACKRALQQTVQREESKNEHDGSQARGMGRYPAEKMIDAGNCPRPACFTSGIALNGRLPGVHTTQYNWPASGQNPGCHILPLVHILVHVARATRWKTSGVHKVLAHSGAPGAIRWSTGNICPSGDGEETTTPATEAELARQKPSGGSTRCPDEYEKSMGNVLHVQFSTLVGLSRRECFCLHVALRVCSSAR
jgi:hypothetical protein